MNQFYLLKHIISSCDEALRDAFEKRMSIAGSLAQSKKELGFEIYDAESELSYIQRVVSEFPPELLLKANSLWSSLTRMNRNQQYRSIVKSDPDIKLAHEPFIRDTVPQGKIVTPENIAVDVSMTLCEEITPCHSAQSALDQVISGDAVRAVVACESIYDADSVYLSMYNTDLFVNSISRSRHGRLLFDMSKCLTMPEDADIMTLAFAVNHTYGSMVQTLSMLSEAKLNIEHMRLRRSTSGAEHPDNLVFIDLSGDFNTLEARTALYQMERELYFFRLLGFWRSGDM